MIRARRTVPLALVLTGVLAAPALAAPPAVRDAGVADTYAVPGPGQYLEGIGVFGDRYYVGATSDGTLYSGKVGQAATVFSPGGADGRTAAIGIKATSDRLYVAGGPTGSVFVYDRRSGELLARFTNGAEAGATFVNDLSLTPRGDAYVTDSVRPVLYRIPADIPTDGGTYPLEVAVDFTGTVFQYAAGFNANGIAVAPGGRSAYVVQSQTGELFKVALDGSDTVTQVAVTDADGEPYALTGGDGLLLKGSTLYVLRNFQELLVELDLDAKGTRAAVVSVTTDETFSTPTTLASARGRLLVVNSQFAVRAAGGTPAPSTVSAIPTP